MSILGYVWYAHLGDRICIYILVTIHTYFGGDVHLGNHIDICILVAMHTYFGGDAHLSIIVYTCLRMK